MHTLSMDDFQVPANIIIVDICWQFWRRKNAHCHKRYRAYFVLPQTLPSELQAQEVLIFNQPDIFCQPELKKKNNNLQTSANNLQNNLQTV